MAKRKIGIEQEKEIVLMYERGQSAAGIARSLKVHPATLRMALRRHNVKMRGGRRCFLPTPSDMLVMAKMYQQGASQKEVGRKFGVSQITVSRFLEMAGVETRRGAYGKAHGNWKGGRRIQDGYVYVRVRPDSPFFSMANNGYVAEHRLKMAKKLKRTLASTETVHHINGETQNNRLSNLQLRQGRHGRGVVLRCRACGSHDVQSVALAESSH